MSFQLNKLSGKVLTEVGVNLLAAGAIAALSWAVNYWARSAGISNWISGILIGLLAFGVIVLFGFTLKAKALKNAEASNRTLQNHLDEARKTNRLIVERLKLNEHPVSMKCVSAFTIDPNGKDLFQEDWTLEFPASKPGRLFLVELENDVPPDGVVDWSCSSTTPGTEVIGILIDDRPTRKQWALFLHPLVDHIPRAIHFEATWPNLWKNLRVAGEDSLGILGRRGLTEKTVSVHIPTSMGTFEWEFVPDKRIQIARTLPVPAQQSLEMKVIAPESGELYRARLKKHG